MLPLSVLAPCALPTWLAWAPGMGSLLTTSHLPSLASPSMPFSFWFLWQLSLGSCPRLHPSRATATSHPLSIPGTRRHPPLGVHVLKQTWCMWQQPPGRSLWPDFRPLGSRDWCVDWHVPSSCPSPALARSWSLLSKKVERLSDVLHGAGILTHRQYLLKASKSTLGRFNHNFYKAHLLTKCGRTCTETAQRCCSLTQLVLAPKLREGTRFFSRKLVPDSAP